MHLSKKGSVRLVALLLIKNRVTVLRDQRLEKKFPRVDQQNCETLVSVLDLGLVIDLNRRQQCAAVLQQMR